MKGKESPRGTRESSRDGGKGTPLGEAGFSAWKAFLRGHSHLMRELDQEMRDRHGVALGDFDVLAQLSEAPGGHLRMCDLAAAVVLSPSGLSRRVDRLEREGLVKRARAAEDARSVEASLTARGRQLLGRLRAAHMTGVKARFADRFSAGELKALSELLPRLTQDG